MSFDQFVAERSKRLWRAAYLLTGDRHKAEDLVQTALTKVYSKYSGDDAQFEGYVRTTMYHTYISWWRRKWNAEVPHDQPPEAHTSQENPASNIDLLRALSKLPKMQRAVLVLRYYEDRSIADVATSLGISEGTVKSHSHRACEALRGSSDLSPAKEALA